MSNILKISWPGCFIPPIPEKLVKVIINHHSLGKFEKQHNLAQKKLFWQIYIYSWNRFFYFFRFFYSVLARPPLLNFPFLSAPTLQLKNQGKNRTKASVKSKNSWFWTPTLKTLYLSCPGKNNLKIKINFIILHFLFP